MKHIAPLILAACVMALVAYFDLPKAFGAHPWWSVKTVLIGTPIGLILALVASFTPVPPLGRLLTFTALLALAYGLAFYGKTQFAASYAEDALAGKLWYFGWLGVSSALAAIVTTLFQGIATSLTRKGNP